METYTFNVRLVDTKLFGVVEASPKSTWRNTFANASQTVQITFDETAFALLAKVMQLDTRGLAYEANRYARGEFWEGTEGLGGAQLGTLGEVLVYLVKQPTVDQIVRVIPGPLGTMKSRKGVRFPRPDFIVKERNVEGLAALEVKSTQAFNVLQLEGVPGKKKWTYLQPCAAVVDCRQNALEQLGETNDPTVRHGDLNLMGGTMVPFPVSEGIAASVLAVDGRVNGLRGLKQYKTPTECRGKEISCWNCVPDGCHFVLTTMHNLLLLLLMAGSPGKRSSEWLRLYQRWSDAIVAGDIASVRYSANALASNVAQWLQMTETREPELLSAFWGSYMADIMFSQGFDMGVPEGLTTFNDVGRDFEWRRPSRVQPICREVSLVELPSNLQSDLENDEGENFVYNAKCNLDGGLDESITVRGSRNTVEFSLASKIWQRNDQVRGADDASGVLVRLLELSISLFNRRPLDRISRSPIRELLMKEVTAKVGDSTVRLGWVPEGRRSWSDWHFLVRKLYLYEFDGLWQRLAFPDDAGMQIYVLADGRANMTVARASVRKLLQHGV